MRPYFTIPRSGRKIPAFTAALMAAGLLAHVRAEVQTAGNLFVDVDATGLEVGPLNKIVNKGSLGGVFAATGGDAAVPAIQLVGGTKAIRFDGGDFLQSVADDGTPILAPADLTGENPTRSIEVWALNEALDGEETLVSWGHRGGGPDGSNMSFNYGSDFRWGAVGHWGNRDLGWNNNGGGPAAGHWHHLVYTYDGTTTRVYSDGAFANGEYLGPAAINTHPDTSILIASQTEPDGVTATGGLRFTGAIGRVRVHDGVLTPAQIANNYNFEKAAFIDPTPPPPIVPERLAAGPAHRYSFNDAAGDAENKEITDSVGTANGVVLGAGGAFNGSRLVLPGGSSATAPYGDLPNGLLSSHGVANGGTGQFTIETWVKFSESRTWGRVFDFGSTVTEDGTGELFGPGGGGEGKDYLALTSQIGNDVNARRLELRNEDPAGGGVVTVDNSTVFNTDLLLTVTWDEASGRLIQYQNGVRISSVVTDDKMSDINDVNVWLGRSNWTGDQNAQGEWDEVRIYDTVLTPGQALGNALAGPDVINDHDVAVTITQNPLSQTVPDGGSVVFSARPQGSTGLTMQWYRNGNPIPDATQPTYRIDKVSTADNGALFTLKAFNTVNGQPATATSQPATLTVVPPTDRLTAGPVHRYSFSEPAGDATNLEIKDSAGAANGVILGDGATFTGSKLALPGGSSASAAYADLPNGLLSSHGVANGGNGKFTIETWVKLSEPHTWGRVFDFGSSVTSDGTGEVFGPGGGGEGKDYLALTSQLGDDVNSRRLELRNEDPAGGGVVTVDNATKFNTDLHLVVTWDEATGKLVQYENGRQVSAVTTDDKMSDINDVNVWLGRSNWTGDQNAQGEWDEVRIYDAVLTQRQVLGNTLAGPDIVNDHDTAVKITQDPQSLTLPETAVAAFSVKAPGSSFVSIQWFRDGKAIPGANSATYTLGKVTAADNGAVFTATASNTVNGQPVVVTSKPATLTVQPYVVSLKHRFSFDEPAGSVQAADAMGGPSAVVNGAGAVFGGGQITLDGLDSYVDLPNGTLSGLGADGTIELWITHESANIWSRIFDFGISDQGEDQAGGGVDYIILAARAGDGFMQFTANFPGGGDVVTLLPNPPGWLPGEQQTHIVISWRNTANLTREYIDGALVASGVAPRPLSDMAGRDVNNWLGRSQFIADAFWGGKINEVRFYSGAMSDADVAASLAAGPDALTQSAPPSLKVERSGGSVVVSWPASATGFGLEGTAALGSGAVWTPVAGASANGDRMQVTLPASGSARFLRLKK